MPDGVCPRLIEVALPIREISAESVRDKSLRHGHISTLHLWWARRPLAASRAVVFASLVPDPDHPDCPPEFRQLVIELLKEKIDPLLKGYLRGRKLINDPDPYHPYPELPDTPRNRLLTFIAKWSPEWQEFEKGQRLKQPPPAEMLDDRCLVKWETSDPENEQGRAILDVAHRLIKTAYHGETPIVLDPFAGGGAIPLEASRLGCQAIANDYNPVAYLILRATCEFPQKYGKPGKRLVEQEEYGQVLRKEVEVKNVLVYDVEYWAKWILESACKRIGHLYPSGKDGKPVVGYLWARTAPCSNPACHAEIPLLRSLLICDTTSKRVGLTLNIKNSEVQFGVIKNPSKQSTSGTMIEKGKGSVRCPICHQITPVKDLRRIGLEGKFGNRMIAVITDSPNGKEYRPVEETDLDAFQDAIHLAERIEKPTEYIVPEINSPCAPMDSGPHRSISVDLYGYKTFGALFNARQLITLQTFVECVRNVSHLLEKEILDTDYRNALLVYLSLFVSKISMVQSSFGTYSITRENIKSPFGRQSIAMVWDYPESNPFTHATAGALMQISYLVKPINHESSHPTHATVIYGDGAQLPLNTGYVSAVITDPPYFDAIAYADLSDYFYIWLKRILSTNLPSIFITPQTPKTEEAVAHKHRHHGDRAMGKDHFQRKLEYAFCEAKRVCISTGVVTVMFAHQNTEAWSALINALFNAGLNITATYPIDTELTTALKHNISALASSITVICRPRQAIEIASLRDIRKEIDKVVADSVHRFFEYGLRGADLIVSCYGPAVGVFGRYERVERADGTVVSIPELLELARQSALKAIAGVFTGDPLSRLYFVWANLYGVAEQAWDDARLVVQIGGDSEDAMQVARGNHLFVVDGAVCRLALLRDRNEIRHLGEDPDSPLIDQLHQSMRLWKMERRTDLVNYLLAHELAGHEPFWKLAQALFEVLPRSEEDWKLISALLGERETLRKEVRRAEPPEEPIQGRLFEDI